MKKSPWPFFRSGFGDFNEMFQFMQEMLERDFQELNKQVPTNLTRERTLPDGTKVKSWGPFVYGYSVNIGPDGKPQVQEFGNVKRSAYIGRPKLNFKEKREPMADVMTTDEEIKVIVELPGVNKQDIILRGTKQSLTISVDTSTRKYFKELKLPGKVDLKGAKSTYNNGVLEVTFKKRNKEPTEGEKMQID